MKATLCRLLILNGMRLVRYMKGSLPGVENIKGVACGKSHTLVRTRDGSVFGWGTSAVVGDGKDDAKTCHIPRLVPSFCTKVKLSCSEH
jgi:alpha-tubulin suppressor-like RCC1 family protein